MFALLRFVPLPVFAVLGVIVFYEGLPVIKWLPIEFVSPLLGDIATGRVDIEKRKAVASLRIEYEEARRKLLAQIAAERESRADKIAELERNYLRTDAARAVEVGRLKEIINGLEDAPADAPPAFPRRMSDALNRVGR